MPISYHQAALNDIHAVTVYLEQFDPRLAQRFEVDVHDVAELALANPDLGRPVEDVRSPLHGARFLFPRHFRNWIVFYHAQEHEITILRVLHGSRDIEKLE